MSLAHKEDELGNSLHEKI